MVWEYFLRPISNFISQSLQEFLVSNTFIIITAITILSLTELEFNPHRLKKPKYIAHRKHTWGDPKKRDFFNSD